MSKSAVKDMTQGSPIKLILSFRSEERRVGKECH